MILQRLPSIYFAPSALGGRGVFTGEVIAAGSLLEICPAIVIPAAQKSLIDQTKLYDYYFLWGVEQKDLAIAGGFGSLYNHSTHPNARYELDLTNQTIDFYSISEIVPGEEITVNYHGEAGDVGALWFEEV